MTTANDYAEMIDLMLEHGETEELRAQLPPILEAYQHAILHEYVVEKEVSIYLAGDSR